MSTPSSPLSDNRSNRVTLSYPDFEIKQVTPAEIQKIRQKIFKCAAILHGDSEATSRHYVLVEKELRYGDNKLVPCLVSLFQRRLGDEHALEVVKLILDYRFLKLDEKEGIKFRFLNDVIKKTSAETNIKTFWVRLLPTTVGEFKTSGWKIVSPKSEEFMDRKIAVMRI